MLLQALPVFTVTFNVPSFHFIVPGGASALSDADLVEFLKKVSGMPGCDDVSKIPRSALVKGVVGFVRSLESVDDLDNVGGQIFE